MGRGQAAAHAAGAKEGEGHQQQDGSDDDWGIGRRHECAESERSHQGDVESSQHDAEAAGAAERRRGQAVRARLPLRLHLGLLHGHGGAVVSVADDHVPALIKSPDVSVPTLRHGNVKKNSQPGNSCLRATTQDSCQRFSVKKTQSLNFSVSAEVPDLSTFST